MRRRCAAAAGRSLRPRCRRRACSPAAARCRPTSARPTRCALPPNPDEPAGQDRDGLVALARADRRAPAAARRLLARHPDPARAARDELARRPVLPARERLDRAPADDGAARRERCAAFASACSSTTSTRPIRIRCCAAWRRSRTSRCASSTRSAATARGGVGGRYTASIFDFGRLNHRMHNKLFIADGVMAVAGGRNIADEYFLRSRGRQLRRHGRVRDGRGGAVDVADLRPLLEQRGRLSDRGRRRAARRQGRRAPRRSTR